LAIGMSKLKRSLGPVAATFFGVGSILGAGIYTLIGKVAGSGGNLTWLAFVIASFTAVCTAFSYAELSAAFPKAGGEYEYAKKAFGKKAGLLLGLFISANGIISGATVSLGFAGYFSELTGFNMKFAALAILTLIFLVNASGIRESSAINIIFTLIELGGLLFVIYAAAPTVGAVNYAELPPGGLNGLFAAAALAYFAFIGFEDIVKLSEETRNPEKNMPRTLFASCAIVFLVYSAVAVCAVSALPAEQLAESKSPLAAIVDARFGRAGVIAISVIALFSTANTILANMMGSSRVLFGMSKETGLLKIFSPVGRKRKTPYAALLFILLVMCAFSLIGNIETVALIANVFIFLTFLLVNIATITLRIRHPRLPRPYRIPLSLGKIPLPSLAGILMTLLLLGYNLYNLFEKGAGAN
jgi:basic amino acid/polyamine antiporter, APA family